MRNSSPTDSPGPFDEESVENWEIGFKSDPTPRLRFNAAAFFTTAEDLQRAVLTTNALGPVQTTANTADSETFGLEFDVNFAVTDNLVLIGSLGYLDADYTEVLFDISGNGDLTDDLDLDLPATSKITSSASVIHTADLGNIGYLTTRLTYRHRDTTFDAPNRAIYPSTDILDLNITFTPTEGNWDVSVYGRNLTNDVIFTQDLNLPSVFGSTYATMAKGRQIGLEAKIRF